jgi:L-ascorbate metabolism protein UlaG (beta-lactamase superfamily)
MADEFTYNPALPIIRSGWKGNLVREGKFKNQFQDPNRSLSVALRWMLTKNPRKEEKQRDTWLPTLQNPRGFLQSQQDGMVWLGHATFFIRLGGVTFLADPVFHGVSLKKRKVPFPVQPEEFPAIDYVLLSHGHFDHCDKNSLIALRKTHAYTVLTSLKMKPLIQPWLPQTPIQEAGWYQQFQTRGNQPQVFFLPTLHWHKRTATDTDKILWGSFMLQAAGHTLYFGADSGYDQHYREIRELFPGIDTCILGIGAYSPSFIMQPSHTDPAEAVRAFNDLGGKTLVPMHYGTFDLSDEPLGEPLRWLKRLEASGEITGALNVLAVGEATLF